MISIWCGSKGNALFSFSGLGFLGACLEWGDSKKVCFMVNFYSKTSLYERKIYGTSFVCVSPLLTVRFGAFLEILTLSVRPLRKLEVMVILISPTMLSVWIFLSFFIIWIFWIPPS